jgi:hypothetical protein
MKRQEKEEKEPLPKKQTKSHEAATLLQKEKHEAAQDKKRPQGAKGSSRAF